MQNELVIEIEPSGGVVALHSDGFPLNFLGRMEVQRQTDIRYTDGFWDIHYIVDRTAKKLKFWTHKCIRGFDSYNSARDLEVRWLNACRLEGVDPMSTRGQRIAQDQREEGNG
jgi:hypothetical protein